MAIFSKILFFIGLLMPFSTLQASDTTQAYRHFVEHLISFNGRVERPDAGHDTVSEGQAYALLLAVWHDDQLTFDRVYRWTIGHLSRKERYHDNLLAWRWHNGQVQDWNPATDADLDFAYALLLADEKWNKPSTGWVPSYRKHALAVLDDILEHQTAKTHWGPVILPGPWAKRNDGSVIYNPSYFAPSWYRKFALASGNNTWNELVTSGYVVMAKIQKRLDNNDGVGLVPDWCRIQPNGQITTDEKLSQTSSWDAFRISWRIADDWHVNKSPNAKHFLQKQHQFFEKEIENGNGLALIYSYAGKPLAEKEQPIAYIPYLCTSSAVGSSREWKSAADLLNRHLESALQAKNPSYYSYAWLLLALSNPSFAH